MDFARRKMFVRCLGVVLVDSGREIAKQCVWWPRISSRRFVSAREYAKSNVEPCSMRHKGTSRGCQITFID